MITVSEMVEFMHTLPSKKDNQMVCEIFQKLFRLDVIAFQSPSFRKSIVECIERNFYDLNDDGKAIAASLSNYLLLHVFYLQNPSFLYEDFESRLTLMYIRQLFYEELETVADNNLCEENDEGISMYDNNSLSDNNSFYDNSLYDKENDDYYFIN